MNTLSTLVFCILFYVSCAVSPDVTMKDAKVTVVPNQRRDGSSPIRSMYNRARQNGRSLDVSPAPTPASSQRVAVRLSIGIVRESPSNNGSVEMKVAWKDSLMDAVVNSIIQVISGNDDDGEITILFVANNNRRARYLGDENASDEKMERIVENRQGDLQTSELLVEGGTIVFLEYNTGASTIEPVYFKQSSNLPKLSWLSANLIYYAWPQYTDTTSDVIVDTGTVQKIIRKRLVASIQEGKLLLLLHLANTDIVAVTLPGEEADASFLFLNTANDDGTTDDRTENEKINDKYHRSAFSTPLNPVLGILCIGGIIVISLTIVLSAAVFVHAQIKRTKRLNMEVWGSDRHLADYFSEGTSVMHNSFESPSQPDYCDDRRQEEIIVISNNNVGANSNNNNSGEMMDLGLQYKSSLETKHRHSNQIDLIVSRQKKDEETWEEAYWTNNSGICSNRQQLRNDDRWIKEHDNNTD